MKIVCLTVGKKHDPNLATAIQKYQTRLSAYVLFEFEYLAPADKASESAAIIKKLKPNDMVLLLDESGTMIDNRKLANSLASAQNKAVKRMVIIIGGAYGVDTTVTQRADMVCSLSLLVFPHQLVRLLVVEQLYRSFNLLAGGKYHHL